MINSFQTIEVNSLCCFFFLRFFIKLLFFPLTSTAGTYFSRFSCTWDGFIVYFPLIRYEFHVLCRKFYKKGVIYSIEWILNLLCSKILGGNAPSYCEGKKIEPEAEVKKIFFLNNQGVGNLGLNHLLNLLLDSKWFFLLFLSWFSWQVKLQRSFFMHW